MLKADEIRALWDEGVKFTNEDMSAPKMVIYMIIKEIEKEGNFENEKINDLYILLRDLKNLCETNLCETGLHENTLGIISKYYKTTKNFESMNKFEQFGLLKVVIQRIIYDLAEEGDKCEN